MNILERISDVLEREARAIGSIAVSDVYSDVVELIANCSSKVITTGIGKAGHIAHKFSSTLSSTGTPSVLLHAAEAAPRATVRSVKLLLK